MKKNLKRKIKEDEFISWFEHAWQFGQEHAREVKIAAVVVGVLAIGGGALGYFRAERDREAHDALTAALDAFHAPVASEAPAGANAPIPRFATPQERYAQALGQFQAIVRKYGSSPLATRAEYYEALCRLDLGQLDEGESLLRQIAGKPEGKKPEAPLARLALADVERRRGEVDRAAESYKKIIDDPSALVPREYALMSLAQVFEQAKRLDEAQATYQRLVEEFPTSSYAADARKRVEYLQERG